MTPNFRPSPSASEGPGPSLALRLGLFYQASVAPSTIGAAEIAWAARETATASAAARARAGGPFFARLGDVDGQRFVERPQAFGQRAAQRVQGVVRGPVQSQHRIG